MRCAWKSLQCASVGRATPETVKDFKLEGHEGPHAKSERKNRREVALKGQNPSKTTLQVPKMSWECIVGKQHWRIH